MVISDKTGVDEILWWVGTLAGLPKQSYKAFFLHGPKQKYNSLIQAEQRLGFQIPHSRGFFDHIAILDCNLNKLLKCLLTVGLEKDYFSKPMTLNQLFSHNCAMQVCVLCHTSSLTPSVWNWKDSILKRKWFLWAEWDKITEYLMNHASFIVWIIKGL